MPDRVEALGTEVVGEEPRPPPRRWVLAAAVAVGAALAAVAALVWLRDGGVEPPSFAADPLVVADAYQATLNGGDLDAFMGLFAPGARIDTASPASRFDGPDYRHGLRLETQWKLALGGRWELSGCTLRATDTVTCTLTYGDDFLAVGGFRPEGTVLFMLDGGMIAGYLEGFGVSLSLAELWADRFQDWVYAEFPDAAERMFAPPGGAMLDGVPIPGGFPLYTRAGARLHLDLVREWPDAATGG